MRVLALFLAALWLGFAAGPGLAAPGDDERRVFDQADLLSLKEEGALEERVAEFRRQNQLDLVLLTIRDAQGKSAMQCADDFYDQHDFGVGADKSGLLLLIDMDNRISWVSTSGRAIGLYSDARIERILDRQLPALKSGDYRQAFALAIDAADEIAKGKNKFSLEERIGLSIVIGLAGGVVFLLVIRARYRRAFTGGGENGVVLDLALTEKTDRFLNSSVSSWTISNGGGSGGGGSSTHRSSSGRSHGGGGRSF